MKIISQSILALFMIILFSAFAEDEQKGIKVTYGASDSNPAQIELKLNEDMSFSYQDFSVASDKIQLKGSYEIQNKKIILQAEDGSRDFHRKWKISKDGTKARSRKAMLFYTLTRQ